MQLTQTGTLTPEVEMSVPNARIVMQYVERGVDLTALGIGEPEVKAARTLVQVYRANADQARAAGISEQAVWSRLLG